MIITRGFIGIDVSKHHLDVFEGGSRGSFRIANGEAALAGSLLRWKETGAFVVFEATGHYDARLRQALAAAGIAFARVNPARARDFARATGTLAKTDRIDARLLAAMAQSLCLVPARERDPIHAALTRAHKRRDQLVQMRKQEKTRLGECDDDALRADLELHIQWLAARIACREAEIARLLTQSAALAQSARRLRSIPGIGPVAATTLLALVPELGALSPKKITALAGLAPFNVDSGTFRGKRRIKGGRKRVRDALYMAAVAATRCNQPLKNLYTRLRTAGKPAKVALIALARKLLIIANAILRDKTTFKTT